MVRLLSHQQKMKFLGGAQRCRSRGCRVGEGDGRREVQSGG
jgi:hypothetical protein